MEHAMESTLKAVFVTAIEVENRSMSFYHAIAFKLNDIRAKQFFVQMSKEEESHLELICNLYPGDTVDLVDILFKSNMYLDPYYCSLLKSFDEDRSIEHALKISLKEEQACIDKYSVFAETIRPPQVHAVFVQILNETHKHCDMIEQEYMRQSNMMGRMDQRVVCVNAQGSSLIQ
jgi:rubrerythrin